MSERTEQQSVIRVRECLARLGNKSSFCGKPVRSWSEMAVDQITPRSRGGKTDLGSAALSHARCNSRVGAKHPKI